jgi:hypothetical protein
LPVKIVITNRDLLLKEENEKKDFLKRSKKQGESKRK